MVREHGSLKGKRSSKKDGFHPKEDKLGRLIYVIGHSGRSIKYLRKLLLSTKKGWILVRYYKEVCEN